jgi:hypothetical protein
MAIAFDAAQMQSWQGFVTTWALSHTVTGSNPVLFAAVGTYDNSGGVVRTPSSVTYNGVACTRINGTTATVEGNKQSAELWYLDNPATGAHDISVTLNAESRFGRIGASSYTGKTSSGIDAHNAVKDETGSENSPTCNVNVSASDCWLVGYAYSRSGSTLGAGTATTIRANNAEGQAIGDSNGVVSTGNQTLAFTETSSVTWPGIVSASFSEAGSGGPTVEEGVGVGTGTATVTGTGRSFAHVVGVSSAVASVAGVGANANAGERETVGTSTGQASVVGVGQSEVFTVGNSAGSASVVGVGEAVQPPGQAVGTSAGIATVLGVASSIAEAVGTSSGSSDASGVNPQVVVTQRLAVGAGGELSWEDHVKTIHEMRMLEGQVRRQRKELQKVVKQIKSVEKKFKAEKTEGILANLHRLEQKKDELENKIEALEVDLEPLTMAIEKFEMREIEEDDQEFMSLM